MLLVKITPKRAFEVFVSMELGWPTASILSLKDKSCLYSLGKQCESS